MAETEPTQEISESVEDGASGASKSRKLIAFAVVLVAVLVNLGLAYAFIPSAEEIEAQQRINAGMKAEKESEEEDNKSAKKADDDAVITVEEPLVEDSISAFQPLSSTTIRVDFKLWGIVAIEDSGEFREQYIKHENRIKEQILFILRSSDIDDLSESGLGLIKRKILDKSNNLLDKPYLRSVHFSSFSFVEQ